MNLNLAVRAAVCIGLLGWGAVHAELQGDSVELSVPVTRCRMPVSVPKASVHVSWVGSGEAVGVFALTQSGASPMETRLPGRDLSDIQRKQQHDLLGGIDWQVCRSAAGLSFCADYGKLVERQYGKEFVRKPTVDFCTRNSVCREVPLSLSDDDRPARLLSQLSSGVYAYSVVVKGGAEPMPGRIVEVPVTVSSNEKKALINARIDKSCAFDSGSVTLTERAWRSKLSFTGSVNFVIDHAKPEGAGVAKGGLVWSGQPDEVLPVDLRFNLVEAPEGYAATATGGLDCVADRCRRHWTLTMSVKTADVKFGSPVTLGVDLLLQDQNAAKLGEISRSVPAPLVP